MTTPVAHGYPDFGRFVAQSDSILLRHDNQGISASTDIDLGFVGNYAGLGFAFLSNANGFWIEFRFYQDEALTNFITSYVFDVFPGKSAERVLLPLGPYLMVRIIPSAALGDYDLTIWSAPNLAIPMNGNPARNVIISQTNAAIAATSNTLIVAARVWPGDANWTCRSTSSNWTAELHGVDYLGVQTDIDIMAGNASTVLNHRVFLPSETVRVKFTNNEAAARNFWLFVNGRPLNAGA